MLKLLENIIEIVSASGNLTSSQITEALPKDCEATLSQVVATLLGAERQGLVERLKDEEYDELSPLTTAKWRLAKPPGEAAKAAQLLAKTVIAPLEEEQLRVVVSQPIFAFPVIEGLRGQAEVLEVREAIEKVVIDAELSLRVMCPYYDNLFLDILHRNMERVQRLKEIRIISERQSATTLRAARLFSNVKVKSLFEVASAEGLESKVRGVHGKMLIADEAEALVGSFNLTFSHILYNIDIGLLVRGRTVKKLVNIFDALWSLPEER